ncbi:hypothetical protein HDK90DRAFT_507230 [Phyllosticta capitalensis]|uniref:Ubiquitin 3 binding protein But2 C-terminal domain-containing protein n=1 Tax=Phyllosticta capitalensis TaxID=121624 RepID=A0ABR1Z598_9PEZI
MHAPTLLTLSGLLALTTAAPSLSARQEICSIAYPSLIFQLISTSPDTNTGNHSIVPTGFSGTTEYVTEAHFEPLAADTFRHGACRLQLYFLASGAGRLETNPTNHKLNFYSVDGEVTLADTWNSYPATKSLVGTVDVVRKDPSTGEDTVLEINSPACSVEGDGSDDGLNYRVEIEKSGGQTEGFVQWWQESGAGLRVLYNC